MDPDAFQPPGKTPESRAKAIAEIGRFAQDKRKGGERVGQLIFNAIRTKWPIPADHTASDAAVAHRLFNIYGEDLAAALEEYLAPRAPAAPSPPAV